MPRPAILLRALQAILGVVQIRVTRDAELTLSGQMIAA
jgi:hypothetical protein